MAGLDFQVMVSLVEGMPLEVMVHAHQPVFLMEEVQVVALFCLMLSNQYFEDSFSQVELTVVEEEVLSISPARLEQYH
jgi:hypothetical protein